MKYFNEMKKSLKYVKTKILLNTQDETGKKLSAPFIPINTLWYFYCMQFINKKKKCLNNFLSSYYKLKTTFNLKLTKKVKQNYPSLNN